MTDPSGMEEDITADAAAEGENLHPWRSEQEAVKREPGPLLSPFRIIVVVQFVC